MTTSKTTATKICTNSISLNSAKSGNGFIGSVELGIVSENNKQNEMKFQSTDSSRIRGARRSMTAHVFNPGLTRVV